MKVTTSRDPSPKTRRLGKALARFLSLPYLNRGKQGLGDESWIVVVENHGNPTGFIKRSGEIEERLSFAVSIEPQARQLKKMMPAVIGSPEEAKAIAEFFELGISEDPGIRYILAASGRLDFVDEGETIIRLNV